MRMITKLFGIAVALIALMAGANAQTVGFLGTGSSAMFLQLGLAAGTGALAHPAGIGAICLWSRSRGATDSLQVTDTKSESGQAWIAWTPGTNNVKSTCLTINSNTVIYAYVQTDSVIGDRLYFNHGTVSSITTSPSGSSSSGLILGTANELSLPAAIWNAVNGKTVTAAATDIRPEDAKFATNRALTACNTPVVSGSQYLGLGYLPGGQPIHSYYSANALGVTDFTLPTNGSYTVIPMGAAPIVVAVNPSNTDSGFGTGVSDISHTALARFLDGTHGSTSYLSGAAGTSAVTVLIPEPLSGAYNTMEFSIPNSTWNSAGLGYDLETSQDVGFDQHSSLINCDGPDPISYDGNYTMHIVSGDNPDSYRNRVIGSDELVSELLSVPDALGYAFWSTANFKNATSTTGRYLTVDGYDPLLDPSDPNYATNKNTIPTSGNGLLSKVTFTDLQAGNYPIWSLLRLVTSSNTSSTAYIDANKVASTAQNFVSTTTTPNFVPFSNGSVVTPLKVLHSHFAPPGVTFASYNGSGTGTPGNGAGAFNPAAFNCSTSEAGGDVGGVILTVTSDNTYCSTHTTAGQTSLRK